MGVGRLLTFYAHYLRSATGWIAAALASMPVYGLASAGLVALVGPLFADVLGLGLGDASGLSSRDAAVPETTWFNLQAIASRGYVAAKSALGVTQEDLVYFTPALIFALFAVRNAADYVGSYAFQQIGLGTTNRIRNDLYRRFLEQGQRFHREHASGALVSRVVSDVAAMQSALSNRVFDVLQQAVTLLVLVLLLFSTNVKLASLALVTVPAFTWVFVSAGRRVRRSSRHAQDRMADLARLLTDGLRGLPVVQAFGMEAFEHARFRHATARHLRVSLRVQRISILVPLLLETILAAGAILLVVVAAIEIRTGAMTPALVLQFIANLWLLYDPVRKMSRANLSLQQAVAASERVIALLDRPLDIEDRPGAKVLGEFADRIRFDEVTVRFGDRTVLDRVSFEIRRGEVVALVGPSGAGKSTAAGLLLRFFDPDEGRVTIDGHDVRDLTLSSLRGTIGLVTQHTLLFDDTIRNNIAYGRRDMPADRVEAAARAALVEPFVQLQPLGYDTPVGEAGASISGGERQRLAIARALAKDAPVLVLDEATSQLDYEAEGLVHRAMKNLMRGRTVLVIAHRLSTVADADRIVVLDAGRVVAAGRHADLMAQPNLYRRLVEASSTGGHGAAADSLVDEFPVTA